MMKHQASRKPIGLTLTELVVVVSIMVVVAGVMVPMVQPLLKGQNVREASRIVSVFFSGAQARAAQKGRPVGVWIERAEHNIAPGRERGIYTAYRMFLAEEPAPYSGDLPNARLKLIHEIAPALPASPAGDVIYAFAELPNCLMAQPNATYPIGHPKRYKLVKPGDSIRFNYRGDRYRIFDVEVIDVEVIGPMIVFKINVPFGAAPNLVRQYNDAPIPAFATARPLPFQIFRQPRKTSAAPIEMPNGTALDLSVSGIVSDGRAKFQYEFVAGTPPLRQLREVCPEHDIVIMFKPEGGIDRIHFLDPGLDVPTNCFQTLQSSLTATIPQSREVLGAIQILIGRDDLIGLDPDKNLVVQSSLQDQSQIDQLSLANIGEANLRDTSNIWLTISGTRVTTSPNAGVAAVVGTPASLNPLEFYNNYVLQARQLTRSGQNMGGQ